MKNRSSYNLNSLAVATLVAQIVVSSLATSAIAAPANEVFSAVPQGGSAMARPRAYTPAPANAVTAPGAMDQAGVGGTPETRWMEKLDAMIFQGYPTPNEKVVLSKSFNQEAERVQQWIMTAQTVALKYRTAAKNIRNLPVPANWTEFDQYRNERADWFDDAALVYEDMIRPRRPAKTIEELNSQLASIEERSTTLAQSKEANREFDRKLRREHHIHAPRQTDALTGYVNGYQSK